VPAPAAQPQVGRVGCPHCINDGSEVSLLLQQADALYSVFKTKEALQALARVLQLEPNNYEALGKSSRGYIDLGDMVPETDSDAREKKLKQYQTEEYAGKAALRSTLTGPGAIFVAASLGKIASHLVSAIDLAGEMRVEIEKAIVLTCRTFRIMSRHLA
jgi:hypothetical protein